MKTSRHPYMQHQLFMQIYDKYILYHSKVEKKKTNKQFSI